MDKGLNHQNTLQVSYWLLAVFVAMPFILYPVEPVLLFAFLRTNLATNNDAILLFLLWAMIGFLVGGTFLLTAGIKKGLIFSGIALLLLVAYPFLCYGWVMYFQNVGMVVFLLVSAIGLGGALSIPFHFLKNFKDEGAKGGV